MPAQQPPPTPPADPAAELRKAVDAFVRHEQAKDPSRAATALPSWVTLLLQNLPQLISMILTIFGGVAAPQPTPGAGPAASLQP